MESLVPIFVLLGFILIICGVVIKISLDKIKENNSKPSANVLFVKKCNALLEKKNEYLEQFEGDDEYYMLDELYKRFPQLFNDYSRTVLGTPMALSKPASPYTVGLIGTMVGGGVVGALAAMDAMEKERKYKENVVQVIKSQIETGNARDKVNNCFLSIVAIIDSKETTQEDWSNEVAKIESGR